MMRVNAAERMAFWAWFVCLVSSITAAVVAWAAPSRVLYLVDLDRQVRPLPEPYRTVVRVLISAVAATLLLVTVFAAANWRRVRPLLARVYSTSANEFLERMAADWATWRSEPGARIHAATLVLLLALGLWFRLAPLHFPVSYDESISLVWFSSRSWLDVLSDYTIPNNHILYNLLVKAVMCVRGVSVETIRLPALMAGLAVIPASYWLVCRLLNREAALLTAGMVAAAPVVVEYSTQGRGYTLLWLTFVAAFILATYVRDRTNRFGWALLAITTTAGLWTIPVMLYCTATIAIWLLLSAARTRRLALLWELAVTGVAVAVMTSLLYLPVLIRTRSWTLTSGHRAVLFQYPMLAVQWTTGLHLVIVAALAISLVIYVLIKPREERRAWHLLLAGLLAHLGLTIAGTFPPNRVLHYLFFPVAGVAAYGLARASEKLIHRQTWGPWLWSSVVLVIAGSWGWTNLNHTRVAVDRDGTTWVNGLAPGSEGTTCCADGYFVDAQPVVATVAPHLEPGDAIVAKDMMGSVETMRFYLIEAGLSPVLVHPYRREYGLRQLEPYGQLYVLVKDPANRRPDTSRSGWSSGVPETLDLPRAELEAIYRPPVALAAYRTSALYRLDRIVPDLRSRASRGPVPFNMLWYW